MKMHKLSFVKMAGAGNDFIVIDNRRRPDCFSHKNIAEVVKALCSRRTGIGADGVLVLEKSKRADFKMRILNADGSVAEMCGNGLRCAALYAENRNRPKGHRKLTIETKAGIYEAGIIGGSRVRVKMEEPKDVRLNLDININSRSIKVNYINTGVPHAVIFVHGLDKIDIESIGSSVRNHRKFMPRGANVDFVEIIDDKNIKVRTYERGVEGETLACGTGAVASAIIACRVSRVTCHEVNVHTKGGVLKVYFKKIDDKFRDVYLEGDAKEVYKGEVGYV